MQIITLIFFVVGLVFLSFWAVSGLISSDRQNDKRGMNQSEGKLVDLQFYRKNGEEKPL